MLEQIKNVLVTGGAGLIGSHVVDELIHNGFKVRVLDNLGPPTHNGAIPPWLNKQAEFRLGDVRDKADWAKALVGMDAVIHLAAYMDYHLDFSNYIRTNIESVALLFELIVEKKLALKKIIIASSQSVYGQGKYRCPTHGEIYPPPRSDRQLAAHQWEAVCPNCQAPMTILPAKEGDTLLPQTPYGISKLASEQLLMNLGRRYGVPSVALRYSIALGPHQSFRHFYSGALRSFAVNVLNNEPIEMNEDGQQLRDFVHVADVAKAHRQVLTNPRADWQVFNVGSGQATRVMDLAKIVAQEGGAEFRPSLTNRYRVGDARHSLMDIDKLKQLGWEPKLGLGTAVRDYLNWVRQFGNFKEMLNQNENQLRQEGILKAN